VKYQIGEKRKEEKKKKRKKRKEKRNLVPEREFSFESDARAHSCSRESTRHHLFIIVFILCSLL
jgi:hypothetical protein